MLFLLHPSHLFLMPCAVTYGASPCMAILITAGGHDGV